MLTLKEVIGKVATWDNVWKHVMKHYPEERMNMEGYFSVFNILLKLPSCNSSDYDYTITMKLIKGMDGSEFHVVLGLKNGMRYAIEHMPWNQWLSCSVDERLIGEMSFGEIMAHCLFEMTWAGFTQGEIAEELKSLNASSFN